MSLCVLMCTNKYEGRCLWRPEESILRAAVTSGFEAVWVLGTKLMTSSRAVYTLNHWAVSHNQLITFSAFVGLWQSCCVS